MFNTLDASNFKGSVPFYNANFEYIMHKISVCYSMIVDSKIPLPKDENLIRDVLVNNYLNNNLIKEKLDLNYFFNPEVPEKNIKRPDIKIQSPNDVYKTEAYYSIECKVLNNKYVTGTSGLNAKYIKNGIRRFTDKEYASHFRVNGMIGFIVDQMDIQQNTENINSLLKSEFNQINTTKSLMNEKYFDDFEYHYSSTHKDIDNNGLRIYHLMLDVSDNVLR
jgi:hypothetical protein